MNSYRQRNIDLTENKKIIIAVDAMGGDKAPVETVKGAVLALNTPGDFVIKLVGDESRVNEELSKYTYDKTRLEVVHASQVIETEESPVKAIKTKKDSSMVKSFMLLKNGEADAFVTCGNTGATLVGGQVIAGRIKGVERPALGFIVPTLKGPALIIDCGANVDAKPANLVQFAEMGYIYMRDVVKVDNPRVGILNIGEEAEKGNNLVKETFPLLKENKNINFTGSIESRGIPYGEADVIVCDAFVGNLVLKMYEGVCAALLKEIKDAMMSTTKTKIGALLIKKELKKTLKKFSIEEYGGAPLMGLKSIVIKTHGSSDAVEIKNSILQSVNCIETNVVEKIANSIKGDE